uniref:Uncharacterized protein n=1 Tax=Siphoviridae sp. ct2D011 TaxID=2825314 RepID=A0A8S5V946_9CAUD|nr:MAG TPA: hypothetical protein [Siphoviridae sp. ct2D011]
MNSLYLSKEAIVSEFAGNSILRVKLGESILV